VLEPVLVRHTRFNPLFSAAAVFIVGLVLGALISIIPAHRFEPFAQAAYSPPLGAKLIGLRADPYVGPTVVLACLAQGVFCDERWVAYAAIDAVADLSRLDPYGACVPGCLFVSRGGGDWTCERHGFYLPLASRHW
jgi:hypothetical protein